jgi:hypothetical protein
MTSGHPRNGLGRRPILPLLVVLAFASSALLAQYQRKPPDFGGTYTFPTPTHPEPRASVERVLDVLMLGAGLGFGAYLILKRRTRTGVVLLSIAAIAYFGFYRKGCTCPIGAIQNVTLALVDPRYLISFGVLAFFFLPLVAALLVGRVFCGAVCPHGAVQDLVLLRPKKVPERVDRVLRWLPSTWPWWSWSRAGGCPSLRKAGRPWWGGAFSSASGIHLSASSVSPGPSTCWPSAPGSLWPGCSTPFAAAGHGRSSSGWRGRT